MYVEKKLFLFLLLLTLLFSCQTTQKVVDTTLPTNTTKDDGRIKFTFLQINDVYEISPMEGGKVAGMARVAALDRQLQEENPNTLFVLAGDFLNPSLYGTIKYDDELVSGRQMVEVMNTAGVDLVAFGNHEFDLSEKALQDRINLSEFQWIGTNVLQNRVDSMPPFSPTNKAQYVAPFYQEKQGKKNYIPETYRWQIKDEDGTELTIGIFSATINSNPKPFVTYEDYTEEATKAYLELACRSDLVLGLTHLKVEEDMALAAKLPNVPLLMGGHEHHHMKVDVGDVTITKADANAKTAWVHRFEFDKNTGKHTLESKLVNITNEIVSEPNTQKVVTHWEGVLHEKLKEVYPNPNKIIYRSSEPLDGRAMSVRTQPTNLGQMICNGIAKATNTEAALLNAGSIRIDDQLEGAIQAIDIFRVMPFKGNVAEIELSGTLLLKILEYGLVERFGSGSYLQSYNLTYDKMKKVGTIGGQPIQTSSTYRVGFGSYILGSLMKRGVIPKKKINKGMDLRVAVINYLEELYK